jgi:hypothetical protein
VLSISFSFSGHQARHGAIPVLCAQKDFSTDRNENYMAEKKKKCRKISYKYKWNTNKSEKAMNFFLQ